jgi:hypothetical protein
VIFQNYSSSGIDLSQVPPLMDVNDLVDAALIGFDRKETITIPKAIRLEHARHDFLILNISLG